MASIPWTKWCEQQKELLRLYFDEFEKEELISFLLSRVMNVYDYTVHHNQVEFDLGRILLKTEELKRLAALQQEKQIKEKEEN